VAKQAFKKCLGVDIGTTSVKIAEVVADKAGAKILSLVRAPIPAFPDAEAAELGTAKIIRDLVKERGIRTREAVFCLPGQQIFLRRVRLPDASEDRLTRIINYEARQQIPFPEDKTRIEYQVFRIPDQEDVEVLMVAARKDQIASYMRLVGRTGLRPIGLSVSSLALFNYHAFELTPFERTDKGKGKSKKGRKSLASAGGGPDAEFVTDDAESIAIEDVKALINIGETFTDLVICRKGKAATVAFSRSIPIAGREMTRVIGNAVGISDMAEANRLKIERVKIFSTATPNEGDPNVDEAASQAATDIVESRLAKQIQLSLDFFIAQPDGMAVDSVLLSGGPAPMPGLAESLEDRLALNVKRVIEPTNTALFLNVSPERTYEDHLIAMGAGLSGIEFAPVTINFLPETVKTSLAFPKIETAVLGIFIVIMIYLSTMVGNHYVQVYGQAAQTLEAKYQTFQPLQQSIADAEKRRTDVKESIEKLLKTVDFGRRSYLIEFYSELVTTIKNAAPLAYITYFEVEPHGRLELRGVSSNNQDAPKVKGALDGLSRYIETARLAGNFETAPGVWVFTINGKLKHKASRISTPIPTAPPQGQAPAAGIGGGVF